MRLELAGLGQGTLPAYSKTRASLWLVVVAEEEEEKNKKNKNKKRKN